MTSRGLTENAFTEKAGGVEVDAPTLASSLKVDLTWIEDRVGDFSTEAFSSMVGSVTLNEVVAQGGNITRAFIAELFDNSTYVDGLRLW